MEAVGNGLTVTTAEPLCACEHEEELASLTLTKTNVYVVAVFVGTRSVAALLPAAVVTVRVLPFMV